MTRTPRLRVGSERSHPCAGRWDCQRTGGHTEGVDASRSPLRWLALGEQHVPAGRAWLSPAEADRVAATLGIPVARKGN